MGGCLSHVARATATSEELCYTEYRICILSEFSSFVFGPFLIRCRRSLNTCQLAAAIWPNCNMLLAVGVASCTLYEVVAGRPIEFSALFMG